VYLQQEQQIFSFEQSIHNPFRSSAWHAYGNNIALIGVTLCTMLSVFSSPPLVPFYLEAFSGVLAIIGKNNTTHPHHISFKVLFFFSFFPHPSAT
jgi:hypothetical protein